MPLRQTLAAVTVSLMMPITAMADGHVAAVDALYDAMSLDQLIEVMRAEGLGYGEEIANDLFGGPGPQEWVDRVDQIYGIDVMSQAVRSGLTAALEDEDLPAIQDFFDGELGQEIIALEVSARQALMDEAVEEASKEAAALALIDDTPRAQLVTEFVEINDLVETNVVGAMNANYAFYLGLMEGGGLPDSLSQDEILRDVWSQEDEIRQNTSEWVYSYLMMAYQPLSDEDLQAYIAFSKTDAGEDINAALFAAFDGLFEDISRALGRAASMQMISSEL